MKFKSVVQSLLKQNYHVSHLYHRLRLWVEGLKSQDKIIVYTMAKVGSTTVWKSLEDANLDAPIYHIHTLNPASIKSAAEKNIANFPKLRFVNPETAQSEYLQSLLVQNVVQNPWHVVTLVRDPIAREVSNFFERLDGEISLGFDYRNKLKEIGEEKALKEVIDRFFKKHVDNRDTTDKDPFDWFNYDLKSSLDVDIFAYPPLAEKGYRIYTSKSARVLLLKTESLNDCCQSSFQDFLGLRDFKLVKSNVGSQKRYRNLYKNFLREVKLPTDYIEKIYSKKLVRHLYSDSELEVFSQRWKKS
ncbi:MAG: putative capsular polysaccharide synthesis family protein [Cyanobacteria bacterium J06636_16]